MANHFANIHVDGYDPAFNMPYVPAIKVFSGKTVYVAGVTAAGIYHSHPHVSTEFDQIPSDPAEQARMAMDNLGLALRAAGGDYSHVVQLFRFIKDLEKLSFSQFISNLPEKLPVGLPCNCNVYWSPVLFLFQGNSNQPSVRPIGRSASEKCREIVALQQKEK